MSSSSDNRQASAIKGGTGTTPTPANTDTSGRRRSSGSGRFAGLMGQKRNSVDEAATARKASFAEQKAPVGFLGSMWNSFTRGGAAANPNAGSKQAEKPTLKP